MAISWPGFRAAMVAERALLPGEGHCSSRVRFARGGEDRRAQAAATIDLVRLGVPETSSSRRPRALPLEVPRCRTVEGTTVIGRRAQDEFLASSESKTRPRLVAVTGAGRGNQET
jgi:hypothetical protein